MNAKEDDELVGEMDVFITRRLRPNLHIFQFPVGLSPFASSGDMLINVRTKPKHKKFEFEVAFNTESKNFDRGKSEQIAYIANGAHNGEQPYFPDNVMNKQTLKSIEVNPTLNQYVIGVISDGNADSANNESLSHRTKELHLTPLSSVMQFRPSFNYFDKSEIRVNKSSLPAKEDPAIFSDDEAEVKRINVRFAGPDEERLKKLRENSYSYLQQQISSEAWVDLDFHDCDDINSQNERRLLLYNASNDHDNEFVFEENSTKSQLLATSSKANSLQPTKTLSLSEQVRTMIVNAKVLCFSELKDYLGNLYDESTVLRYLQQYAMLVQGNWVVKSEILYPKESGIAISPLTGIPIDVLCRVRDYIMWLFTQSHNISRKQILSVTKIPEADLLMILKQMSVYNAETKLWDFILPVDNDFIKRYSDVVTRQKMLWEVRYTQLDRSSKGRRDSGSLLDNAKFSSPTTAPRKRRRSRRDSSASGTDLSENECKETLSDKKKAMSKRKQTTKKK
ncbi:DNA-directed RNA polymerase III subunit RPC5-like protein [Dinothrombium tinctorium]|uniref:DNA-directed RNA polymerase III subunit RPC5-like protein n=1 Tax=Dinothrombium tinctorium TaxID=1965070 RepID=A0A3S3P9J9_9ACAR|nr:DNA-directed RNA polymerase III subunit RPC5-like protein [Dinothrombium tinctorium]